MMTRSVFRFLLPVAAAVVLLLSGSVERARADAKDVQEALAGYQFTCAINRIYRAGLAETESKLDALSARGDWREYNQLNYSRYNEEEHVKETGKLCNEYRQKFITAFTAYLIDVALTEQAEEKPAAKPKPEAETTKRKPQPEGEATTTRRKPQPEGEATTTRRKPKPEAETTRRPVAKRGEEAPAGPSHDPTASALVGIGVGIAIGRGIGGGGGGGGTIGGGGGGGGRHKPSGGGRCPGGSC